MNARQEIEQILEHLRDAESHVQIDRLEGHVDRIREILATHELVPIDDAIGLRRECDLFHENVRDEWIVEVFRVMARCPQHTFQILTKRPERMLEFCNHWDNAPGPSWDHWPLKNVWLGVSVENQATADERIPLLLETPAAVRFISYEPALGPVEFGKYLPEIGHAVRCLVCGRTKAPVGRSVPNEIANGICDRDCEGYDKKPFTNSLWPGESRKEFGYPRELAERPTLDWVIVGGESGPNARPFDIEWARSTVRQCKAAGVSVFVKQMGANAFTVNETMETGMEHHPNCSGGSECARLCPVPVPERGFEQEPLRFKDRAGADPSEWPEDLRMQEFPGLEVRK